MKPAILVIYYSQTGQLKHLLDSILAPIQAEADIDIVAIEPTRKFPFPWTNNAFFDCMPECVLQIPEEIDEMLIPEKKYDLVILGYQPWFLSPSIPITSFLESKYAHILKKSNVITVIGSRNMWLNAQEKIKEKLKSFDAQLIGNIVFRDKNPNLTSILTVIRWSFKGKKEAGKFLPEAGISQLDIQDASKFGPIILSNLTETQHLHNHLLHNGSVFLNPALIILEKRGIANFRKFASYIREKGERGNPNRLSRVKLFNRLLLVGVFLLSPISAITAKLSVLFNKKTLEKEVSYFKSIGYKQNAI
jgi:hypothetical protein